MKFLKNLFNGNGKSKFMIVEVEKPRDVQPLDEESVQSVVSLQGHPGFLYLLSKLRYQRALLEANLYNNRQPNIIDVEFLKSGIAWTKWLEQQLSAAVALTRREKPQPSLPAEQQAFEQISQFLESVGVDADASTTG